MQAHLCVKHEDLQNKRQGKRRETGPVSTGKC